MTSQEKHTYWTGVFTAQKQSGLSKKAFCRQEGLSLSTFYYWQQLCSQDDGQTPAIVPLILSEAPSTESASLILTLPNGCQLSFSSALTPQQLKQYIAVLS
ncbi:hypothetical protein SG34_016835 [Thalassomonas viridans]|uniref:Transposase n=1 Tax=Thalassomonas viridans TaxID=137584 RepID=A0AAF0C7Q7_9GAMM|nr:hypothetical protein [Thalassomonas viridans]WDE03089.1 hypothetical protein SG34_016835 [Thalassomonas viridans]